MFHSVSHFSPNCRYQNAYMLAPIEDYWQQYQVDMLAKIAGRALILAGDGRYDSPGFSEKYCTYTETLEIWGIVTACLVDGGDKKTHSYRGE